MGDVSEPDLLASDVASSAERAADAAASTAGIVLRDVDTLDGLAAVAGLYHEIWQTTGAPPISTELLRALTKAGNYVGGAYLGDQLIGACVGFFSAPADGALHSHIAGVSSAARGRNVGFALKLHQRAWALRRGVSLIAWTVDPLVARNAWFNLAKLGARPVEYLPNFYGGMHDQINGGDASDRLLMHWELTSPRVVAACEGVVQAADAVAEAARGAETALGMSPQGTPVPRETQAVALLVAVPPDIEALRATDPALGARWRSAVRDSLAGSMTAGARVVGFDRAGWYVLHRPVVDAQGTGDGRP